MLERNNHATLFARYAQALSGREMVVDALLRWLVPFHPGLPRLLVDLDPTDIVGMIPPEGTKLTLYNAQAASLPFFEQRFHVSIESAPPHEVTSGCSLLIAPKNLGIGTLLHSLGRFSRLWSPEAKHVHGILRTSAIRELELLSMVYQRTTPM